MVGAHAQYLPTLLRPRRSDFRCSCQRRRCAGSVPLLSLTRRSCPPRAFLNWPWAGGAGQGSGEGWAFWQVTQSCRFLIFGLPVGAGLGGTPPPRSFPHSHSLARHPGLERASRGCGHLRCAVGAPASTWPNNPLLTLYPPEADNRPRALLAGRQRRVNFALDHLESYSRPVVNSLKDTAVVLWKS